MEHDLLDDYLKLSEKIEKDDKIKNIVTTAQKRKECETKALRVVFILSQERSIDADIFLKYVEYLNPSYYEDIVVERALNQVCGYSLCRKKISKPKSRYKISNISKKVYDLEEYGKFCSTFCFDASNHIKSQILDSPLWLRDVEDLPKFKLLEVKKQRSSTGINIKSKKLQKCNEITTISSFAKLSLDDVGDIDFSISAYNEDQKIPITESPTKISTKPKLSTVMENVAEKEYLDNVSQIKESDEENMKIQKENRNEKHVINHSVALEVDVKNQQFNNDIQKVERKASPKKCRQAVMQKTQGNKKILNSKDLKSITDKIKNKIKKPIIPVIDPLPLRSKTVKSIVHDNKYEAMKSLIELKFLAKDPREVENTLKCIINSWLTIETLMFLHGENKLKNTLNERNLSKHFENLRINQLEIDKQKKYISICRKLCEEEIFEEKIETLFLKNNLKPPPDYEQLKRNAKEFNIKVKTFLEGGLHECHDKNFGSEEDGNTHQEPTFSPLADNNSQNALRQQILSDTLNKSMLSLLDYMKYESTFVFSQFNELIKTFKLNAENIVFKPVIRSYMGFICLKILSIKDSMLCKELNKAEFVELQNSIFEQLPGKKEILMNTMKLLNDVNTFLETHVLSTD